MKPKKRSRFRIFLGIRYYRLRRYLQWYFGNKKYAKDLDDSPLKHVIANHKTPLLRKLKDVDMWLQHNKIKNLKIATKNMNGLILRPGETFSYWKLIGSPTKRKGYVKGMNLFYGGFRARYGGGLCQLSNLIYWMTLHTPLTVTERYRHSFDVFPDVNRKQPFGSGATCVYNYRDLQIYNDTDETYQLYVYLTDDYLVGEWRSNDITTRKYEVYEKKHWFTHEYWGGYVRNNILHRKVFDFEGQQIDDEYITENHAVMMYQPLLGQTQEVQENV